MLDGTALIYVFDGTFDGALSAIFDAYARRQRPSAILPIGCQSEMDKTYVEIETDAEKARRVTAGIRKTFGYPVYTLLWDAFLYGDERCGDRVYQYLLLGFSVGRRVTQLMTDERVMQVNVCARAVEREASALLQFIRFSELEGGVYYSAIEPTYPVLPLLMPHFVARYHVQPFLIHDQTHCTAGVWDGREWVLRSTEALTLPAATESEQAMRRLWRTFYDSVAIRERENPALRRAKMPKKYWRHITEMQPLPPDGVKTPADAAALRQGSVRDALLPSQAAGG